MNAKQRIELRRSEISGELAALSEKSELAAEDTERVGVLTAELKDLEVRFQAAALSESVPEFTPVDETADRDLTELRSRASLGRMVAAAANQKPFVGADAEYAAAVLPADTEAGVIPISMLETRQTATSSITGTAPDDTSGSVWREIQPRVFQTPITEALGITTDMVAMGQPVYPVLTAGSAPGAVAESGAATTSTAAVTITPLQPRRITNQMTFTGELAAMLPQIEETIRRDMNQAFANEVERQVLVGDGTAPNFSGITHGITAAANPGAVTTWQEYSNLTAGAIDGQWANRKADVQVIMPIQAYTYGMGLWQTTTTEMNGLDALTANSGGVFASAHLPNAKGGSGNDAKTASCYAVRHGGRQWAQLAIWDGFSVIRDPYTNAGRGQTTLTGVLYANFDVIRSEALVALAVRHTA